MHGGVPWRWAAPAAPALSDSCALTLDDPAVVETAADQLP